MVSSESEKEAVEKLDGIKFLWTETGLISSEDMSWLLLHARSFFSLGRISDDSWVRNKTEIFTLNMEIEELKRQLKEALGN